MCLETLLRSSLIRFNVSVGSLRKVLQVTTTLYRKAAKATGANPEIQLVNPIAAAMLEITKDNFLGKARVNPSTLIALVEVARAVYYTQDLHTHNSPCRHLPRHLIVVARRSRLFHWKRNCA